MSEAEEEYDALPVLARDTRIVTDRDERESSSLTRRRSGSLPSVQAAAAAAGGFVAGAAVLGLVQRRHRNAGALVKAPRKRALARRGSRGVLPAAAAESLQVVSSSAFLVEVHLLGTRNSDD
jgi:hypothetical protein